MTLSAPVKVGPQAIMVYSPVVLQMPGRPADLELKVSLPVSGDNLPVLLLSHGHGNSNFLSSLHGYAPLADYYAAQGFVVIQPTHLSSKTFRNNPKVDVNGPEGVLFWRSRAEDMRFILDHLGEIEAAIPALQGRVNKEQVAAVGHSLGGQTVCMLAGMQVTDPQSGEQVNLQDTRVKAAVVFGAPGDGQDLNPATGEHYPALKHNSFAEMTTPALIVAGDKDMHPLFSERPDWRADAYRLSPGPKDLLTVFDGGHMLGGISGYDAAETTDEDPARLAFVQEMTTAYLRSALFPEDQSWQTALTTLQAQNEPLGRAEHKSE